MISMMLVIMLMMMKMKKKMMMMVHARPTHLAKATRPHRRHGAQDGGGGEASGLGFCSLLQRLRIRQPVAHRTRKASPNPGKVESKAPRSHCAEIADFVEAEFWACDPLPCLWEEAEGLWI